MVVVQGEHVLGIALIAALVTSIAVPPDRAWLEYFDLKTLTCLFCVLAVVNALRNILFFTMLANKIVMLFRTTRMCILAYVHHVHQFDVHCERHGRFASKY